MLPRGRATLARRRVLSGRELDARRLHRARTHRLPALGVICTVGFSSSACLTARARHLRRASSSSSARRAARHRRGGRRRRGLRLGRHGRRLRLLPHRPAHVHDYHLPRIIGSGTHLHPIAVVISILCGAELAGISRIFSPSPSRLVSVTTPMAGTSRSGRIPSPPDCNGRGATPPAQAKNTPRAGSPGRRQRKEGLASSGSAISLPLAIPCWLAVSCRLSGTASDFIASRSASTTGRIKCTLLRLDDGR